MTRLDLALDDIVQLRKPHPCGGYRWRVTRLGADIGLRCMTCEHKVMLPRATVEQRTKAHFDAEGQPKPAPNSENAP